MRRALSFGIVLLVGAVAPASAQLRPFLEARIDTASDNRTGLLVRVSGLLDTSLWFERLDAGYTIQIHWTVQLYKSGFLIDRPQGKTEWDTEVHAVPLMKQYIYTDRVVNQADDRHTWETLDSLKAYLGTERVLRGPRRLEAGSWYYNADVDIKVLTPEEIEARTNGGSSGGGLTDLAKKILLGTGPTQPLHRPNISFTIP